MSVKIPEGMSSVDTFNALYTNAQVIGKGSLHPAAGREPTSAWNAIQLFQAACPTGYCDYVRGKGMKVDFKHLDEERGVVGYDRYYGKGAAQKAINAYRMKKQLDPQGEFNLHGEACTYFTSFWRSKAQIIDSDLEPMFERCKKKEEAEKEAQNQKQPSKLFYGKCEASYALVAPYTHISHTAKPCREAIDHLKNLLKSGIRDDVDGLRICRRNAYVQFMSKCQPAKGPFSLEVAIKILEASNPNT